MHFEILTHFKYINHLLLYKNFIERKNTGVEINPRANV